MDSVLDVTCWQRHEGKQMTLIDYSNEEGR